MSFNEFAEVIKTREEKKEERRIRQEKVRCPLCGSNPRLIHNADEYYHFYTCPKCDCDYKIDRRKIK